MLVIDKLCEGKSLRKACKEDGTPGTSTFHRWLTREGEDFDWLRDQYARAREIGSEINFDKLLDLAEDASSGKISAKQARVAGYLIERHVAKTYRRKFGDRVDHTVDAKVSGGVMVVEPVDESPEGFAGSEAVQE